MIRYKGNGNWDLGDLEPAAIKALTSTIKKAKDSAQSWGKIDLRVAIEANEKKVTAGIVSVVGEKWAVNPNVHFNEWMNYNAKELRSVVEAYKNLMTVFECEEESCGSLLRVTMDGMTPDSIRCECAKTNWPLNKKPADSVD